MVRSSARGGPERKLTFEVKGTPDAVVMNGADLARQMARIRIDFLGGNHFIELTAEEPGHDVNAARNAFKRGMQEAVERTERRGRKAKHRRAEARQRRRQERRRN